MGVNEPSRLLRHLHRWWRASPAGRTLGAIGALLGIGGIWIGLRALEFDGWSRGLIVGLIVLGLLLPLSALMFLRHRHTSGLTEWGERQSRHD